MDLETVTSFGPEVGVGLAALAIAGVVFTVLARFAERRELRESLSQVDGYDVTAAADAGIIDEGELQGSFMDRIGRLVLGNMGSLGNRFTPTGYIEKVRHRFVLAGRDSSTEVDRFMALRVLSLTAVPFVFVFFFIWNPLEYTGFMRLSMFGLLSGVLVMGQEAKLNRAVEERQSAILLDLPDVLDLLTISVEAGLGFEQALDRTIATVPGALSTEFARMLGETRAGSSRADAMRAMDQRISLSEVRSFVLAILQADTFGVSIGRVLRAQADEMRIRRRQRAQEQAQKAPVKMLIPMVFCIFPSLFVVILVPAMINIYENF
ncbi:MAG: type II secretion system F family protein [Acidimicrobiales bacterium]|nr:type II secretion system F family protein [Acidimicrobiales bacterium]RZV45962.1 MAG: type II secretion system F family protein [Acidimicrobiales bacterium]